MNIDTSKLNLWILSLLASCTSVNGTITNSNNANYSQEQKYVPPYNGYNNHSQQNNVYHQQIQPQQVQYSQYTPNYSGAPQYPAQYSGSPQYPAQYSGSTHPLYHANLSKIRIDQYIYDNGEKGKIAKALAQFPVEKYEMSDSEAKEKMFELLHGHKTTWGTGFLCQILFITLSYYVGSLMNFPFFTKKLIQDKTSSAIMLNTLPIFFNFLRKMSDEKNVHQYGDISFEGIRDEDEKLILGIVMDSLKKTSSETITNHEWKNAITDIQSKAMIFMLPGSLFSISNLVGIAMFSNQRYFNGKNIMINSAFLLAPGLIGTLTAYGVGLNKYFPIVPFFISYSLILWSCNMLRWYFGFYKVYNKESINLANDLKSRNIFYDPTAGGLVVHATGNLQADNSIGRSAAEALSAAVDI